MVRKSAFHTLVCGLLVVVTAGCGSTVQSTSPAALSSGGDPGLGAPALPGEPTSGEAGAGQAASVQDPVLGGAVSTSGAAPEVTSSSTDESGAAAAGGGTQVGADRAAVKIGMMVVKDIGEAMSALGYDGLSTGDGAKQARALVALVNKSGGVGGRPIDPVIIELDASRDINAQYQAACSRFFDDTRVRAVIGATMGNGIVPECARRNGAPYINAAVDSTDAKTLRANPGLVLSAAPTIDDNSKLLVEGLARNGWFRPTSAGEVVKIGLLTHDHPSYKEVQAQVTAALSRAGLSLTDTSFQTTGSEGQAASQGQSTALRFASKGINRVIAVDTHGYALSWFALGAASQNYYPRLGMTTIQLPQTETQVLSPESLEGAGVVGWSPVWDTAPQLQPSMGPRYDSCLKAVQAVGENTAAPTVRATVVPVCESLWLLADAWRERELSIPGMSAGLKTLNTGYRSVLSFAHDWRTSRAGVSGWRFASYDRACDCFRYQGPVQSFRPSA